MQSNSLAENFYIQRLARQSNNQIVPIPVDLQIPERHLRGLENDEFIAAFHTYQEILRQIYDDIYSDPGRFGMDCFEIDHSNGGWISKDEDQSRKAFFRLLNTLLALANLGAITVDGGLYIDVNELKTFKNLYSAAKLTKPEIILKELMDYGFEIDGLTDDFNLKKNKEFTVYYPDNKNVLIVLKAFGNVGFYERMLSADYRHLLSENGYHEQFDIEDVYRIMINENDKKILAAIHEKMLQGGFTYKIKYAGFWGRVRYHEKNSKKEYLAVDIGRDDQVTVKFRLPHINDYLDRFKELTFNVRDSILNGFNCRPCYGKYCGKGHEFEYEGKSYLKCHSICDNFKFHYFNDEDISSVLYLLGLELQLQK